MVDDLLVIIQYGGQPMSDGDYRTLPERFPDRRLDQFIGLRIHRGRRLVQY